MSVATPIVTAPRPDPGPEMPPRKRWNRTEAHFLWDNNLLGFDKKYELIDGDLLEKHAASPSGYPPRKRWTRSEVAALQESGVLGDKKYELIDGEILEKMGQNQPHVRVTMLWVVALIAAFGGDFVRCQAPIALAETGEPEPDIAVTNRPSREYEDTPPASDVRLLIEVSVSTLTYDRNQKARLYAAAGIADYWVSDVANRLLLVHRDPTPDSGYQTVLTLTENDTVSPLADPNATFRVGDFLP